MKIFKKPGFLIILMSALIKLAMAQGGDFTMIPAIVDFSRKLQLWDGFGVILTP